MEQALLWELIKLIQDVTRAAIDNADGDDLQQIISLLTPKFCTDGSKTLKFTFKKGNEFGFFLYAAAPHLRSGIFCILPVAK